MHTGLGCDQVKPAKMLREKIKTIMTSEGPSRVFSFGSFLFLLSLIYGGVVKIRETFYQKGVLRSTRLPCPVISIGNLTLGGTGKTPMTIYVAKLVKRLGYKVTVISRGYKGKGEKTGGIVSNGQTILMEADTAGDESFMMATKLKNIPVVIGKNRFEAGMRAVKHFNPDVLVLDDAFQHLKLERDIDLVLLDNSRPFGNTYLLPRGTLREPVSALGRGDAFVLTRSDSGSDDITRTALTVLKGFSQKKPVFKSFHVPYIVKVLKGENVSSQGPPQSSFTCNLEFLKGRRLFAFSGIADNNNFRDMVKDLQCDLTGFSGFPDHHRYSAKDLNTLLQLSRETKADLIITTEKDYGRISEKIKWPLDLVVVGIQISFKDDEDAFNEFIKNRLSKSIPPG